MAGKGLEGLNIGIYRLDRCLGAGGMGEVYLALDTMLERRVALKVMGAAHAGNPVLVERFLREARAAARLSHPHIVPVHTVGSDDGRHYICMEFIDGISLSALIRREGTLPWQRALQICGQVASALECAHGRGIIHRDIKPANILIDRSRRARVTDFGVAKVTDDTRALTSADNFVGTPAYASPEQCGTGEVGPPSDLFSLGSTLYEMLTGRAPFDGRTPASLVRQITLEPHPPLESEDIPAGVKDLVNRLLMKNAADRFQDAGELLRAMAALRDGVTPVSTPCATAGSEDSDAQHAPAPRRWRRRMVVAGACALALLAVLAGAARQDARKARQSAAAVPAAAEATVGKRLAEMTVPEMYAAWDVNRDNALDTNEIPEAHRAFITAADTSGDGRVTPNEMERAMSPGPPPEPTPDAMPTEPGTLARAGADMTQERILFQRFDRNRDGVLVPAELPPAVREKVFAADLNRDGRLTFEECRTVLSILHTLQPRNNAPRLRPQAR